MGGIDILQAAQYQSEQWFILNWKDKNRKVASLQNRTVKFVHKGEWRKVKRRRYLLVDYARRKHVISASIDMGVCHA